MKPTYEQLLNVVRALVAATSDLERRELAAAARPLLRLKADDAGALTPPRPSRIL